MAKVKFNVTPSDPDAALRGAVEPPKPGVYKAKLVELKPGFKKGDNGRPDKNAPRLEVVVEVIGDKKYKGARLYDYISFDEASAWKMDQFLQVLGVANKKKRTGEFDTDKQIGKTFGIRVTGETYNDEYRARLRSYLLPTEDEDADEDDEDLEDDEDVEDEDESDEEEDEDSDEEEEEEEEESDEDEEEEDDEEEDEDDDVPPYAEWLLDELKEEIENRGLTVRNTKKATLIKALEEDDEADPF